MIATPSVIDPAHCLRHTLTRFNTCICMYIQYSQTTDLALPGNQKSGKGYSTEPINETKHAGVSLL